MTLQNILSDPCASNLLKAALCSAIDRDPIDAVNDAEILLEVLKGRMDWEDGHAPAYWEDEST